MSRFPTQYLTDHSVIVSLGRASVVLQFQPVPLLGPYRSKADAKAMVSGTQSDSDAFVFRPDDETMIDKIHDLVRKVSPDDDFLESYITSVKVNDFIIRKIASHQLARRQIEQRQDRRGAKELRKQEMITKKGARYELSRRKNSSYQTYVDDSDE